VSNFRTLLANGISHSNCCVLVENTTSLPARVRNAPGYRVAQISDAQAEYIKLHAAYLGFTPFDPHASRYTVGTELYGAGTLSLPERFLSTPGAQAYVPRRFHPTVLDAEYRVVENLDDSNAPVWWHVLQFYGNPEIRSGEETDPRCAPVAVRDCKWVSTEVGTGYAPEIRVADLWRILASFNPNSRDYTNQPNTKTSVHVCDLWISVPTTFRGRPVVFMSINPDTIWAVLPHEIPSLALATAICGGRGLEPDQQCGRKLYGSAAPDWSAIKMPLVLAFATIPLGNRCFFMAQHEWAKTRVLAMIRVCHFLWDHADAIDLDESGTPVKVLFENIVELIEDRSLVNQEYRGLQWRAGGLMELVQGRVSAPSFLDSDSEAFVELEDAMRLLEKSDSYTFSNEALWDEDGLNSIVDDWFGCFGERARWIALLMMLTLLQNMHRAFLLPESFDALFHSPTGTCIISP